ncbi:hypothetical protein BAZO_10767 [Schinkia azotoformans LMG 9581]|uniref:Uncharacterized protein n=1 Tax=Schinkia azotoformans LMG 9581 TaxID=1131731 RepID=K6C6V7_SCHAZ|nr:hypothetical protein BAZO_10767 [Schinkia azotoformans LMG 9581]
MLLYYKRNKSNPSHFFTFHKMFISSIITIEIVKITLTLMHKGFCFEKCEHNVKTVFKNVHSIVGKYHLLLDFI